MISVKSNSIARVVLAIGVAAAAAVQPAFAQATAPPVRSDGVFGRDTSNPNGRQKVDLTVSTTGGFDRDSGPPIGAAALAVGQEAPGYSSLLETGGGYAYLGRRLQVRANGGSAQRYLRPFDNVLSSSFGVVSGTGALGFTLRIRKTTLAANQTAIYSTAPLFGLVAPIVGGYGVTPGLAPPVAPAYAIDRLEARSYGTAVAINHDFTNRTAVSGIVDWQRTDTSGPTAPRQTLNMYASRGQLTRKVSPRTVATAGYVLRTGDLDYRVVTSAGRSLGERGVQVGFDHRRPMSGRHLMTVGAQLGASKLRAPQQVEGVVGAERRYGELWGQLTVGFEFGRTWRTQTAYRSGIDYVAGLSQPVHTDTISANVTGLLTRRLDVLGSAASSTGSSALNLKNAVFDTYSGDVRLRFAIARTVATYVEGLYYIYDSRGSQPLVPGLPPRLARTSVRVGVVLRVPAF